MAQDEIITLYTFKDIVEANIALNALMANGIEGFLENTAASGINPMTGVELKIFLMDKEAAEKIIIEYMN